VFPFGLKYTNIVQKCSRADDPRVRFGLPQQDLCVVQDRHSMVDALPVLAENSPQFVQQPVQKRSGLGRASGLREDGPALVRVPTPLQAPHVQSGVGNRLPAFGTLAAAVILEELEGVTAGGARRLENIAGLPVPSVLSGTLHGRHYLPGKFTIPIL
jgi:hypothetical protein